MVVAVVVAAVAAVTAEVAEVWKVEGIRYSLTCRYLYLVVAVAGLCITGPCVFFRLPFVAAVECVAEGAAAVAAVNADPFPSVARPNDAPDAPFLAAQQQLPSAGGSPFLFADGR